MAVLPQPPLVIPMASRLIGLLLYQYLGPVMQPGVETPFLGGWQVLQMGHSSVRAREDALCATSRDHCFYKLDTRARAREPDTRAWPPVGRSLPAARFPKAQCLGCLGVFSK